ncbi:hypothetical protein EYF80_024756 [Liparis tanakae]|uniref:Uncharacterized protein n=1 Tax=Liparis tanakae TaxID=230148 RepID=A0A4Z2HGN3_9TELE|nr:hypothetical protein EYF80_024756 [Liparis tanakae]
MLPVAPRLESPRVSDPYRQSSGLMVSPPELHPVQHRKQRLDMDIVPQWFTCSACGGRKRRLANIKGPGSFSAVSHFSVRLAPLPPTVFNVWLSSHIWLFRLESSQLIAARFLDQRQRVSFRPVNTLAPGRNADGLLFRVL